MINNKLILNDIKSAIENHHVSGQYVFNSKNMFAFMFKHNKMIYILEYVFNDEEDTSNLYLYDYFAESVCGPEYINDNEFNFVEILFIDDMRVITTKQCFVNVDIDKLINIDDINYVAMTIYFDFFSFDPERDDCKLLPKIVHVKS